MDNYSSKDTKIMGLYVSIPLPGPFRISKRIGGHRPRLSSQVVAAGNRYYERQPLSGKAKVVKAAAISATGLAVVFALATLITFFFSVAGGIALAVLAAIASTAAVVQFRSLDGMRAQLDAIEQFADGPSDQEI